MFMCIGLCRGSADWVQLKLRCKLACLYLFVFKKLMKWLNLSISLLSCIIIAALAFKKKEGGGGKKNNTRLPMRLVSLLGKTKINSPYSEGVHRTVCSEKLWMLLSLEVFKARFDEDSSACCSGR